MADVVNIGLAGCPFHTRCPLVIPGTCDAEAPPVHRLEQGHRIACHRGTEELREAPSLHDRGRRHAGAESASLRNGRENGS